MTKEVEWYDEPIPKHLADDKRPEPKVEGLARTDLEQMGAITAMKAGRLDHDTYEQILVGYLIGEDDPDTKNADKIMESGIKKEWLRNRGLGTMFEEFLGYYKASRELMSLDGFRAYCEGLGMTPEKASFCVDNAASCHASVLIGKIGVNLVIKLLTGRRKRKVIDQRYEKFVKEYENSEIGPEKAIENFRTVLIKETADQNTAVIKEHDWVAECGEITSWMLDIKKNPEKYAGYRCGLDIIDSKTNGMRDSHLTIFVGKHGGMKTMLMLNLALRFWLRGLDVLYVSLETEPKMISVRLWCIHTRKVAFSRVTTGLVTTPEDWDDLAKSEAAMTDASLPAEAREKASHKAARLKEALQGVERGNEDSILIERARKNLESKPNRLKIINAGQSSRIKLSQIEQYLTDQRSVFKPKIVFVDYLDLVAPETPHADRKDLEVGEVTKMLRSMGEHMGFSTVTAAQLSRAAIKKVSDAGSPEKANFGTEDAAQSSAIGADADTVFVLWPSPAKDRLKVFTPKARWGAVDNDGKDLQVDLITQAIGDDIESTEEITGRMPMVDGVVAIEKTDPSPPDGDDALESIFRDRAPELDAGDIDPDDPIPKGPAAPKRETPSDDNDL